MALSSRGFGMGVPYSALASSDSMSPASVYAHDQADLTSAAQAQANRRLVPYQEQDAQNQLQNNIDANPYVHDDLVNKAHVASGLSGADVAALPQTVPLRTQQDVATGTTQANDAQNSVTTSMNHTIGAANFQLMGGNTAAATQILASSPAVTQALGGRVTGIQRVQYTDPDDHKQKVGAQVTVDGKAQPLYFPQEFLQSLPNPAAGQVKVVDAPAGSQPLAVNQNSNTISPATSAPVPYKPPSTRPVPLNRNTPGYVGTDGQWHANPQYDPSQSNGGPYTGTGGGSILNRQTGETKPDPNWKKGTAQDAATRDRLLGSATTAYTNGINSDIAKGGDPDWKAFATGNLRSYIDHFWTGNTSLSAAQAAAVQQLQKDYANNQARAKQNLPALPPRYAASGGSALAGGLPATTPPANTDAFFNQFGIK